jgi:Leucine-rich repeat (LRR) protein
LNGHGFLSLRDAPPNANEIIYLWRRSDPILLAGREYLAELTNLTRLDLDRHQITDLNPLAGLTNLIYNLP